MNQRPATLDQKPDWTWDLWRQRIAQSGPKWLRTPASQKDKKKQGKDKTFPGLEIWIGEESKMERRRMLLLARDQWFIYDGKVFNYIEWGGLDDGPRSTKTLLWLVSGPARKGLGSGWARRVDAHARETRLGPVLEDRGLAHEGRMNSLLWKTGWPWWTPLGAPAHPGIHQIIAGGDISTRWLS